jgi:hypothetical protein
MKLLKLFCVPLILLFFHNALSQPGPVPVPGIPGRPVSSTPQKEPPTRFDLDFPGGTPDQLVAAIQKAMGKPLNVIIPDEHVRVKLPALKMKNVNVAELFQALEQASRKTEYVPANRFGGGAFGGGGYQQFNTSYGFRNTGTGSSDDIIWSFYVEKPNYPGQSTAKVCRFYSLASYLERGATVDDITTAIDTGAKMLGDASSPEIRFHKDTKLLIAVGEPVQLEIVDAVLRALDSNKPVTAGDRPVAKPTGRQPKSDEKTPPDDK